MAKLGDGVAIIQGTTERPGEQPLRQGESVSSTSQAWWNRARIFAAGWQDARFHAVSESAQ